jgi:hypothetical protein
MLNLQYQQLGENFYFHFTTTQDVVAMVYCVRDGSGFVISQFKLEWAFRNQRAQIVALVEQELTARGATWLRWATQ